MKDSLVLVTDPEIIAAIERNGYGDPIPVVERNEQGYWVYAWSLEQYKANRESDANNTESSSRLRGGETPAS